MSTFEALKLAYLRSTAKEEPGVLAVLAFGSISGSIGATSVYPLNLIRTRLQASGSSGHPQRYKGIWDVANKTMAADGWRGFYRGLFPTLAKVKIHVLLGYKYVVDVTLIGCSQCINQLRGIREYEEEAWCVICLLLSLCFLYAYPCPRAIFWIESGIFIPTKSQFIDRHRHFL